MPIQTQNRVYSDVSWIGLDSYHSPGKAAPGFLTQADNCLLEGGDVISRPGWSGMLAAPFSAPAYPLLLLRAQASGTTPAQTRLIVSSGGKLYQIDPAGTTATEILTPAGGSLTHNSATAFAAQYGQFGYLIDGQLSVPIRFNLTSGSLTPFLLPPSAAPQVSATATPLASLLGSWIPDTLTGPGQVNRLPNADFSAQSSNIPNGYTPFGANPDVDKAPQAANLPSGLHWLKLDDPYEGLRTTAALANDPVAGDAARHAKQFYGAFDLFQGDKQGLMTVNMTVYAYADAAGTNLIGQATLPFTAPYAAGGTAITVDGVFSFAAYSAEIAAFRAEWSAGGSNTRSTDAPYVANVVCFPFAAALTASVAGTQIEVQQPPALTYSGGTQSASNAGTVGAGKGAGGLHLTLDLSSLTGTTTNDFSGSDEVVLILSKAAGITGLSLRLGLRQDGSSVRYYTNPFVVSADGLTATCDISTVPLPIRKSFRYLEIVLGGDFSVPAASGADLLLFGPLSGAGNLAISSQVAASDYSYVVTEIEDTADPALYVNSLESNPSPASGYLTPTLTQAEGKITLAPPVNPSATAYGLYRIGGVFSDGTGRLIGVLPVSGALTLPVPNPYLSWDPATRTAVDNTPDSFILQPGVFPVPGSPVFYGRDAPPDKAQTIAVSNGRLLLGAGSELYISWLHTGIDALYFTLDQITGDPYAEVKGATFPVGEAANGYPVAALTPYNSCVVIDTVRDKFLLEGYNGQNFQVVEYLRGGGYGCAAARASCLVHNRQAFLTGSGPFLFDGASAGEFGLFIEPLLFTGPPGLFSGCAAVYHNRRLLLSAPGPGASGNTVTYVYDTRYQNSPSAGWTTWSRGFTAAVSDYGDTKGGDLYAGGADGQVYRIREGSGGPGVDTALPGGPAAAITMAVTTRGYGQEGGGEGFITPDVSQQASLLLAAAPGTQATLRIASDDPEDFRAGDPYTVSEPYEKVQMTPAPGFGGFYLTVGVLVTSTAKVRLSGILLRSAPESERSQ